MRGGSHAPSPARDDDGDDHAQEVPPIDRIDRLPVTLWEGSSSTRPDRRVVRTGGERMIRASTRARWVAGMASIAILITACTGGGSSPSASASTAAASAESSAAASAPAGSAAAAMYKIGYSNGGGVGNGFREEQICTAKAQALASGQVSQLTTISRNTDAAGQLSDIRDLIAKGVNAIVFNPNDAKALNPALVEAKAAGIKTVSVDAYVTDPDTYNLYNNQIEYAKLGAKWLF